MTSGRHGTICFRGGWLWTGEDGARPVPGGLMVGEGRILRLLAPDEYDAAAAAADETVDAAGCLLSPPLFNGHVHSTSTLLRGTENSFPLELWSYYAINYGRGVTERHLRAAILLAAAEMIRAGIGGYIDHFPQMRFASAALGAHRATGLRVGFAPFFADLFDEAILAIPIGDAAAARFAPLAPRSPVAIEAMFAELQAGIAGDSRIRLLLGPNAPQRCSERLWALWRRLREDLGLGSHTHLLETRPQAIHARARWPAGLVAEMDRAGLLDARLSVAHGIWLDEEERALLALRGVTLVHNPVSNLMLGSGTLDVRTALEAGVPLALGSDSTNTGGRHDLFEVMRHMLVSGRRPGSDYERWVQPVEAFGAATRGVRAWGGDPGAGRLAAGATADILVLDFRAAGLAAAPVSLESVVVHGDPRSVKALMVEGAWLLRDGRIEVFDEAAVLAEAADCAQELRAVAQEAATDLADLHRTYGPWHRTAFAAVPCALCGQSHRS